MPIPGTGRERNQVLDAGDVLSVLRRAEVDVVLAGHRHVPYVWPVAGMRLVHSGTVSTRRTRAFTDHAYNLIRVEPDRIAVELRIPGRGGQNLGEYPRVWPAELSSRHVKPFVHTEPVLRSRMTETRGADAGPSDLQRGAVRRLPRPSGRVLRRANLSSLSRLRPVDGDELIHKGQRALVTMIAGGQCTCQPLADDLWARAAPREPVKQPASVPPSTEIVERREHPLDPRPLGRARATSADHRRGAREEVLATIAIDRVVVGAKEAGDDTADRSWVIAESLTGQHRRELHDAHALIG
jgi:hypothetical protein